MEDAKSYIKLSAASRRSQFSRLAALRGFSTLLLALRTVPVQRQITSSHPAIARVADSVMVFEKDVLEAANRRAVLDLADARITRVETDATLRSSERNVKDKAVALEKAIQENAEAEDALKKATTAMQLARVRLEKCTLEAQSTEEAIKVWEKENALEAFAGDVGAAVLTSIFGEPKSVREAKKKEAEIKKAQEEATAKLQAQVEEECSIEEAKEDCIASQELMNDLIITTGMDDDDSEQDVSDVDLLKSVEEVPASQSDTPTKRIEAVDTSGAKAVQTEAADTSEAEQELTTDQIDELLMQKRQEAEALLQKRRERTLTDTVTTAAIDALFNAAFEATGSDWADAQRAKLEEEAKLRDKTKRLELFEADLNLLGISLVDAGTLDAKQLKKAYKERSRLWHDDIRGQQDPEALKNAASQQQLNIAYATIRKLL